MGRDSVSRKTTAIQKSKHEQEIQQTSFSESEKHFRALVELTCDWLWEVDMQGRYLYSSPKVKELLGYDVGEVIGKSAFDFMPEKEAERVSKVFAEIVREQKNISGLVNINVHKDGRLVILETSGVPILDERCTFIGYRGIDRDITERKTMEETLRESEERFRLLFEKHASIMLLVEPETGKILGANASAEKFYGFTKRQLCERNIQDINTLSPEEVAHERNRAVHEERNYFVFPHRLASGEIRTVEVRSSPVEFRGTMMLFSIINDITERKQAEEERKKLVNKLQAALADIKTLSGLIPICASCKKIRDDTGYWNILEAYIMDHSNAKFSHGICPECMAKYYSEYSGKKNTEK